MKIKLYSIARQKPDEPVMEELFAAEVTVTEGLLGDQSGLLGAGEVAVLSRDSWVKVCHESATELPWLAHGANLFIRGFEFLPTDLGRTLRIGEAVLEIARESNPNADLEAQAPALYEALLLGWRGGVICKVLQSGTIQAGDDVFLG